MSSYSTLSWTPTVYTSVRVSLVINLNITSSVKIYLILMRIRIQILDLHWKKMDPDSGYFCQIFWLFNRAEFWTFVLFFSLIFMLKLDELFRNQENFIIFFHITDLGFESKDFSCSFWSIFFPLDPDPWIRLFCGAGTRKPKSCGTNGSGS